MDYFALTVLLVCFAAITVARFVTRPGGIWHHSQFGVGNPRPQIDGNESLRRMVEDRYGSALGSKSHTDRDQMDGGRKFVRPPKLRLVPSTGKNYASPETVRPAAKQHNPNTIIKQHNLSKVRAPWGW